MSDNALLRIDTDTGVTQSTKIICDDNGNLSGLNHLTLTEQSAPAGPGAGFGRIYVKNATPNELHFIDDAGTDIQLGAGGGGIGGSTGGTDNAILRADGAGGSTLQNSLLTLDDTGNVTIPSLQHIYWGDTATFITADSTGSTGDMTLQAQDKIFLVQAGVATRWAFEGGTGDFAFYLYAGNVPKLYWATGNLNYPTSISAGASVELTLRSEFGINLIIQTPGPGFPSHDFYGWISYRDCHSNFEWGRDVFPGFWRSGVLVKEQISVVGNNAQVTSALLVWFTSNPANGSILYLKDDWYNRSYGFGSGGDVTVTIGGTVAETLQNLATAIATDGYGAWKAVYRSNPIPDQLVTDGSVVIYCTNQADMPWVWTDRAWVNATMGTMYAISCADCGDYRRVFGPAVYAALGTVDPGVGTFGPYWRTVALHTGDKFTAIFDNLTYTLDKSTSPDTWSTSLTLLQDAKIQWGPNLASWVEANGTTSTGDVLIHASRRLIVETGGSGTNKYVFSETGDLAFKEVAAPNAAVVSYGQYWVKDDTPNTAMFRDDDGNDFDLLGGKIQAVIASGSGGTLTVARSTKCIRTTLNSSATRTIALPPAASMSGALLLCRHDGDGSGTATLDPDGSETIDGGATLVVTANTTLLFWSTGSEWLSI